MKDAALWRCSSFPLAVLVVRSDLWVCVFTDIQYQDTMWKRWLCAAKQDKNLPVLASEGSISLFPLCLWSCSVKSILSVFYCLESLKRKEEKGTNILLLLSCFFTVCFPFICFREILPEKHVEYFSPWLYSFGYELITHSTRLPLISGFYKLLSVAMKIAKKIKYFEVRSLFPVEGQLLIYSFSYAMENSSLPLFPSFSGVGSMMQAPSQNLDQKPSF